MSKSTRACLLITTILLLSACSGGEKLTGPPLARDGFTDTRFARVVAAP